MKVKKSQTKNVAVDMVSAALAHYKKHGRKVKEVSLSHPYWEIFRGWLMEQTKTDIVDAVEFNDVRIVKGSRFMVKHLDVEFEEIKALA